MARAKLKGNVKSYLDFARFVSCATLTELETERRKTKRTLKNLDTTEEYITAPFKEQIRIINDEIKARKNYVKVLEIET